jgi:hypothetical protein
MRVNAAVVQEVARLAIQPRDGGSRPTSPLQHRPKDIEIRIVNAKVARIICEGKHYLKSYSGGVLMNFGIFVGSVLAGVAVLSAGSANLHRLFSEAKNLEVACLARLWLDDRLGRNSESRTLDIIFRHLRQYQSTIKAVVAYSDPEAGHTGTIYRGTGMLYLGWSTAMALYRLPDGTVHHSRSLGHSYGTHSLKHFESHGLKVELVKQMPKHTYVALIDLDWRDRLTRPVIAYRAKEGCG